MSIRVPDFTQRLLYAAALTSLLSNSSLAQEASAMPPPAVTVVELKQKSVALSYQYSARIAASRDVNVRAQVGGILLKRNFTGGAYVKAGQSLFSIDPAPYRVALALANAQLKQAEAQLNQARREEQRSASLFEKSVVSEKSRDDAISARELAEAAVAVAQAQVAAGQLNLDHTSVVAPVDGLTSMEQVSEGSLIGTDGDAGLLTKITQLDPVYVNFSFSDNETAEVQRLTSSKTAKGHKPDLQVAVTFADGSEYEHVGIVDFTSPTIDKKTGTLQAHAVVANPDRKLLPGQFVRARITGVSMDNAITIPDMALMQGPQGQFVYTVDGEGKAKISPVTLGQKIGKERLVTSGLSAGDKVISEGIMKVMPGAPVQVTENMNASTRMAKN
ncbi:efflux RND transporter periplasmic adaptor subunit [Agrobacterium tumefaciens]|uniref:efflux RND transporter periplasmic adaptor subunit n=1 Tax=Agrobacterium tumefaciens TaxID=358 RepID=UPI00220ABF86|nr:efflux RND transporter periplasmic adaptor subunit [Agrobacterium tumefaciens]